MSESQALTMADQLLRRMESVDDDGPDAARRMLAQTLVTMTDRSAHLGSIATMSELLYAASLVQEEEGEMIHLRMLEQAQISEALMTALLEVDQYLLLVATSINEALDHNEDADMGDHLQKLRQSVMLADEHIRDVVERFKAE